MTDLIEALKPFQDRIQQEHLSGNKLALVVLDEKTREALLEVLKSHPLEVFISLGTNESAIAEAPVSTSDEIEIIYFGALKISQMRSTGFGKKPNPQFFPRFVELFRSQPFFEPVILSKDLTVIDGEQRIAAAIELNSTPSVDKITRLPAVVLNTTPLQAKFLRLVLNKSAEFQRWHWDEVDNFLEEHPELLPQLEPLGIFGERVLPESFFGNTVVGYEIHSDEGVKSQQSYYKQEHGLARWAKKRRALEASEAAKSKSSRKAADLKRTDSMTFDELTNEV